MLLYELIAGQTPYADDSDFVVMQRISSGEAPVFRKSEGKGSKAKAAGAGAGFGWSRESRKLARALLRPAPLRLGCGALSRGAEDVKLHRFFGHDKDWIACYNKEVAPPEMLVPSLQGDGDVSKYAQAALGEGGINMDAIAAGGGSGDSGGAAGAGGGPHALAGAAAARGAKRRREFET